MTKKKILTIIGIIVVVASVGLNVYYFGWNKLVTNYRQQGFNVCISKVAETIQQTGQVNLTTASGEMTLIRKTEVKEELELQLK